MDPLAGTPWSSPDTVSGFARGTANQTLVAFATALRHARPGARAIDIGCGAGRNGVPLASEGWHVLGLDLSLPMLLAAHARVASSPVVGSLDVALASMDALPVRDRSADLVVAHGIWNLAQSDDELRRAVREAARIARPGAGLFVFTFSRRTLGVDAEPVPGQRYTFTQFSGRPQIFLTDAQLLSELAAAGFQQDPRVPLTELNVPPPGTLLSSGSPVIYQAAFQRQA